VRRALPVRLTAAALVAALSVGWAASGARADDGPPTATATTEPTPEPGTLLSRDQDETGAVTRERPSPGVFRPLRPLGATDWAAGAAFDLSLTARGSYDRILENLGYEENGSSKGVSFYGSGRVWGPLWLGGRLGMRNRNFQQPVDSANVLGVDLLATAAVHFPLGDWVELGVEGGLGASLVWLRINGETELGPTFRGNVTGLLGLPLPGPVRLQVRVGWDHWRWNDAAASDGDVDLGGVFVGGAVELRPWD